MVFLKKSLLLVLFVGLVSLSICEENKREEHEEIEENKEKAEEKRGWMSKIASGIGTFLSGMQQG
uniref:Phylloxin-B1 n=1 Tax=Phyllomedusa bicolor TaxID=8393 RepID=PLX1_PHYBI|nr:RecName: Full=Phylloxin-B1; Short=PLX-B1; AltName: Full=Phylloxin; Flags: Precursor [Phyllomedusa bicolor]CAB63925.1 phylloxin precursor [Phyllomedusa bicolor]CAI29483.1 phylloxin precursor [Phyllomedusa bicolor]